MEEGVTPPAILALDETAVRLLVGVPLVGVPLSAPSLMFYIQMFVGPTSFGSTKDRILILLSKKWLYQKSELPSMGRILLHIVLF